MYLDYTPDEVALKQQLRGYLTEIMTPELREEVEVTEGGGPLYRAALKRMGADGWLGIAWPKAYGGQERTPLEQFIFADEVQRAGFPLPFLTLNTVGPTLMKYGTEAQRTEFLPKILRGELHFSIGYTEPGAGTDLASLTTRAVRDGDHYVITGQKIYTSLADYADYIWLAARTNPDVPKHQGISIIMVDTKLPGFSRTPMRVMGDNNTHVTHYDEIRVPVSMCVGQENGGWKLIMNQLNHERVSLFPVGPTERFLTEVIQWARETKGSDGRAVIERPWVQMSLARVQTKLETLKLFNWRQAWNMTRGGLPPEEASSVKVFGSEFYVEAYQRLMEILGEAGSLKRGSTGAILHGQMERMYRAILVLTFGGGVNEVQRDIIAMAGLRMPKPPR
jgi:alkylation response protein AidB-like acyl-CoA dehydrogenase